MHHMAHIFVDFQKNLAPIFRILVATLLKKEPFSSYVKSYGYKRSFSWLKQENKRATDLTSMNHEVVCAGDREIFVTIMEGSLEFDLILLQLWNKTALSSRWPSSFKSLQLTSSFLSLSSHLGHKALQHVSASSLSCSYYNLRRIRFLEVEVDFRSHGSQLSLAFLPSKYVVHGM